MMKGLHLLAAVALLSMLAGCGQKYTTPSAGVSFAEIGDADIRSLYEVEPASTFPVRLALVRVQDHGYSSMTAHGYGDGRFSVLTGRDMESDAAFERIRALPQVTALAPLSRLLVPSKPDSLKDLRLAAAQLKADMLLVYSVDTSFNVDSTPLGPLSVITLGFLPNEKAEVRATVAGVLLDVRTGFVYGSTEATAEDYQRANMWSTREAIDQARLQAEGKAFDGFVSEFAAMWQDVLVEHQNQP